MKNRTIVFFLSICLMLLAGCGSVPETPDAEEPVSSGAVIPDGQSVQGTENPAEPSEAANNDSRKDNAEVESVTWRLRIADGARSGSLVLAGENPGALLTLTPGNDIPVYLDGQEADASVLEDGMMVDIVFDGMVMETYPERFGQVYSIQAYSLGTEENPGGSYYDLCGFYLQVLNDLWDKDPGLNENIEYISIDLSQAPGGLSEGEIQAIAWIFGCQHGTEILTFSRSELAENGYLTDLNLDSENKIYEWENGILFTITSGQQESDQMWSLPALNFDAEKWRSPLGAYIFSDCIAVWPEMGTWSNYQVGSEMIS